jgi:hypothetical protein
MGNTIMSAAILFSWALGLEAPWQVNDISFAAKLGRLDICMTYFRNKLHINLVDVGNGNIELGWTNRWCSRWLWRVVKGWA